MLSLGSAMLDSPPASPTLKECMVSLRCSVEQMESCIHHGGDKCGSQY